MKRYSVSREYFRDLKGKIRFHYFGRTDDVEKAVAEYKEIFNEWVSNLTDENYQYRGVLEDCHGIKITDSTTKKVVYEESHYAEEFGWKRRNRVWERI